MKVEVGFSLEKGTIWVLRLDCSLSSGFSDNKMRVDIGKSALELVQGDITVQDTQAVVNAANSSLMAPRGVSPRAISCATMAAGKAVVRSIAVKPVSSS